MANVTNTGHLFTVEILIEDATNGQALEKLLHLLNSGSIKDYRIKSGIDLGAQDKQYEHNRVIEQLEKFKANHTLIRLTVVKGQGIKLSIPCRILNYDSESQNVAVYHVDEKNVYSFKLNEIDDFAIG